MKISKNLRVKKISVKCQQFSRNIFEVEIFFNFLDEIKIKMRRRKGVVKKISSYYIVKRSLQFILIVTKIFSLFF